MSPDKILELEGGHRARRAAPRTHCLDSIIVSCPLEQVAQHRTNRRVHIPRHRPWRGRNAIGKTDPIRSILEGHIRIRPIGIHRARHLRANRRKQRCSPNRRRRGRQGRKTAYPAHLRSSGIHRRDAIIIRCAFG